MLKMLSPISAFMFEPYNFVAQLPKMGIGMLIIFIIIAVIIIATVILGKFSSGKKKKDE